MVGRFPLNFIFVFAPLLRRAIFALNSPYRFRIDSGLIYACYRFRAGIFGAPPVRFHVGKLMGRLRSDFGNYRFELCKSTDRPSR